MKAVATLPRPVTDYQGLSSEELFRRTAAAKRALGDQVMILGHNYQRDEVIEHADFRGDSLLLSKLAAERSRASLYCILRRALYGGNRGHSKPDQTNRDPAGSGRRLFDGRYGGDRAGRSNVGRRLGRILPVEETVMPAVYVNSAAVLKAFCGEHGGITCTSSNAKAVIEWSLGAPRENSILPRRTSGPQYGEQNGDSARADDRLGSVSAERRQYSTRRSSERSSFCGKAIAASIKCSNRLTSITSESNTRTGK